MDSSSGSRALGAASDLIELLRLAQAAIERLERETQGVPYEQAEMIERDLRRARRQAESLRLEVQRQSSGGRYERRSSAAQKPS